MTGEHLELYDRYHLDMTERKGWSEKSIDPFEYFHTFVDGRQDFGHELHYLHEGQLLGVALVDVLPSALSAVYCYYEPAQRSRGLGVYSVLQQILLAKALGAQHVYLGYWIENHRDMRYKARYRPHEILDERPAFDERPPWVVVDDSSRAVPKPG